LQGEFFREQYIELFGDGIFGVDGDKWTFQRKTASHMFSRKGLRGLMTK
jgi:cytochrome P450